MSLDTPIEIESRSNLTSFFNGQFPGIRSIFGPGYCAQPKIFENSQKIFEKCASLKIVEKPVKIVKDDLFEHFINRYSAKSSHFIKTAVLYNKLKYIIQGKIRFI